MAGTSGDLVIASVAVSPVKEAMDFTHEFDEDIIKDDTGNDTAWRAFNEKYTGDLKLRLVITDDPNTFTRAKALAAVLTPYAVLTITDCDIASWNTSYQVIPGGTVGLTNTTAGNMSWKVRRYVDSDQNTLATTTPT